MSDCKHKLSLPYLKIDAGRLSITGACWRTGQESKHISIVFYKIFSRRHLEKNGDALHTMGQEVGGSVTCNLLTWEGLDQGAKGNTPVGRWSSESRAVFLDSDSISGVILLQSGGDISPRLILFPFPRWYSLYIHLLTSCIYLKGCSLTQLR